MNLEQREPAEWHRTCQALDENGRRCSNKAFKPLEYHGSKELYDSFERIPTWVRVWFCKKHYSATKVL